MAIAYGTVLSSSRTLVMAVSGAYHSCIERDRFVLMTVEWRKTRLNDWDVFRNVDRTKRRN